MPMRDGSALNATSLRSTGLPYSFKPDQFSSHAVIANTIRERATQARDEPYCVLDIGCAYGFLRPYLPAPRFYLIGVERDEKAADQARAYYDQIYVADIVTARRVPLRCPVNTIVFGDILEHVADPLTVLQTVHRDYAGNTTQVVISLPNVAHLYMRLNLLLGRFEYADRGIMDRTHLRFFTLSTARRLIADSGLQLRSVGATPVPLPLIH
jgi:SAM-dependent methyltransferase